MKPLMTLLFLLLTFWATAQTIVYVVDSDEERVLAFTPAGGGIGTFTVILDNLESPQDVTVDKNTNTIYVSDFFADKIIALTDGGVTDLIEDTNVFELELYDNNTKLIWTTSDELILRYDFNTSLIDTLYTGVQFETEIYALAIAPDGAIYFSDLANEEILKTDQQGSSAQVILSNVGRVRDIEVDTLNNKIVFTSRSENRIQRADFDGSNLETLVSDIGAVWGLDIGFTEGKLYWSTSVFDPDRKNRIQRSNLDGTNVETLADVTPSTLTSTGFFGLELGQEITTNTLELENGTLQIEVYPNPFSTYLRIDYESQTNELENLNLNLIGADGRIYRSGQIEAHPYIFQTGDLPVGNFFLELRSEQTVLKTIQLLKLK